MNELAKKKVGRQPLKPGERVKDQCYAGFYVTPAELKRLNAAAKRAGMSRNKFMRRVLSGTLTAPKVKYMTPEGRVYTK